jgi:putative addiction module component (TIGR02574 family)
MTAKAILAQARTLPADERIRLVQDLWDTIAEEPESVEISDEHRRILDERMREHEANPGDVVPWEVVKAEMRKALEQHRRERAAGTSKRKSKAPTGKRKAKR